MSSSVFYRKWRPQSLAEVMGQEHITHTLLNALETGRLTHAYVFCGPKGTGKTSTGRILAKALNCEKNNGAGEPCNDCPTCRSITEGNSLDVIEIDAASNRGVDEIRSLTEKVNYAPNSGRYKVYIIDEFHMLTTEASNALLKTLEEPPPHIIFILATTEAHKILPTILSRCQRYDFRKVNLETTVAQLEKIATGENISVPREALLAVSRAAGGSLRDAENLFQQLYTQYGDTITLEDAKDMLGSAASDYSIKIVSSVLSQDGGAAMLAINEASNHGASPKTLLKDILSTLRLVMLAKNNVLEAAELTKDESVRINTIAKSADMTQVLSAMKLFATSENSAEQGMLPLEMAAAEAASLKPAIVAPQTKVVEKSKASANENTTKAPAIQAENQVESAVAPKENVKSPLEANIDTPAKTPVKKQATVSSDVFDFDNMPIFSSDMPQAPSARKSTKEKDVDELNLDNKIIDAASTSKSNIENAPTTTQNEEPALANIAESAPATRIAQQKKAETLEKDTTQVDVLATTTEQVIVDSAPPNNSSLDKGEGTQIAQDISLLREKLKDYCKSTSNNLRTSTACAILRSHSVVQLEDVRDNMAILAFTHKFHMEKVSKDRQVKKDAEQIISEAIGQQVSVECRLEDSDYLVKEALKMGAKIIREETN